MAETNKKWNSKTGRWVDGSDGSGIVNRSPSLECNNAKDVVNAYMTYLGNAKDRDTGTYNFGEWNAKKLVWEMGNGRSLPAVRNIMYKFQQMVERDIVTLGSGPRVTASKETQIKEAKHDFDNNGWEDLCN